MTWRFIYRHPTRFINLRILVILMCGCLEDKITLFLAHSSARVHDTLCPPKNRDHNIYIRQQIMSRLHVCLV